jgi:hypothetical protein
MTDHLARIEGLTIINGDKRTRAHRTTGRLLAHRTGSHKAPFALTLPCGATLGNRYPSLQAAKDAAAAMAPLVADWEALDLYGVFGSEEAARKAYDIAKGFMQ